VVRQFAFLTLGLLMAGSLAHAAVSDIEVVGVTPSALSVVWFSDEAIDASSLRVFNDQAGTDEITAGLTLTADSAAVPNAHAIGMARVTVAGLTAGQTVYVQTVTDGSVSGLLEAPAPGALIEVTTRNAVTRSTASGGIITNDIVDVVVNDPADEATPLSGALLFAEVVDPSGAALTGRVAGQIGEDAGDRALLNLNNLFDLTTGETVETATDGIVRLTVFRGLACTDVADQRQIRYGRIPPHEESPSITELENLVECFSSDRVCDDTVDILDLQFVLNVFGATVGGCDFNPHLDVAADGEINILDAQAVLNNFGESAPFTP